METERLRQFCAIADSGSLTKAAEILNISIGGLSKSLKVLEEEIGFPLFVPAGRGLTISERGMFIYEKAKRVLEALEDLTKPNETSNSVFRIGLLEIFSIYFMGGILAKKFPDQRVEVIERAPGEIEVLVLQRKIDCGLTYLPYPQPGLDVLKIASFELNIFGVGDQKFKAPEDAKFIVPSAGLEVNSLGIKERDGWPDLTLKRNRFHKTNMLSTALDMARNGLGVVFMPNFVARMHNLSCRPEFHLKPIEFGHNVPRVRREVFLLKRSGAEENSDIMRLVSGVRALIKS
jgi:DNA-binding transcriptional LysR family regulator